MLGYLYVKRFGMKIAWANQKGGDTAGAGPYKHPNILNPSYSYPDWGFSVIFPRL
jgi:hypothetical protein